ncbi:hypothetical protein KC660_04505, partial [Candidatus Dojkabacteria bacterium]|nr:hypothetical protein [Candidatus Dojkabacteria bacterium]
GKGTWTFIGEMEFAKLGLRITNIEPIDYQILYKKGTIYLQEIFSKQTADYYIFQSNIESVIKYIPEYLKVVKHETRKASVKEIKEYIQEEALIGVELNSRILNDRDDLSLHFVLIYDFDDHGFFIHDPGLPPIKARHVLFDKFDKAFNFKGSNAAVVVFEEH